MVMDKFIFSLDVHASSTERLRKKIKGLLLARFGAAALPAVDDFCLVVSELVNNCVEHGACSFLEAELAVSARDAVFTLVTDGIMFDPTCGEVSMPEFDQNGELPVGGYGLAIIRQLADTVSYTYRDGKNMTSVSKNCIHPEEGAL